MVVKCTVVKCNTACACTVEAEVCKVLSEYSFSELTTSPRECTLGMKILILFFKLQAIL